MGQDTQLCLWDITDDVLRQPILCSAVTIKSKTTDCSNNGEACTMAASNHINSNNCVAVTAHHHVNYTNHNNNNNKDNQTESGTSSKHSPPTLTQKLVLLSFGERRDSGGSSSKKYSSRSNSSGSDKYNSSNSVRYSELEDPMKLIGTAACPRFDQCPLLEPLICKKISNERLSALIFKEDCMLTSCYDGSVYTWARPGKVVRIILNTNVLVLTKCDVVIIINSSNTNTTSFLPFQTSANAHLVAAASSMSTTLSNDSTSTVV